MFLDVSGCFWMFLDVSGCFWMFLDVSGCFCFSFFVAMIRLSAHDGGALIYLPISTAVSPWMPWQDYPQAYNVGTVGSQRCGPTSTAEDGIPADGSLGEMLRRPFLAAFFGGSFSR